MVSDVSRVDYGRNGGLINQWVCDSQWNWLMLKRDVPESLDIEVASDLHILLTVGKNDGLELSLREGLGETAHYFVFLQLGKFGCDGSDCNLDTLVSRKCFLVITILSAYSESRDCLSASFLDSFHCDYLLESGNVDNYNGFVFSILDGSDSHILSLTILHCNFILAGKGSISNSDTLDLADRDGLL